MSALGIVALSALTTVAIIAIVAALVVAFAIRIADRQLGDDAGDQLAGAPEGAFLLDHGEAQ